MKYYAVTNDPTELMHYGIKGMKWGVIRTDAQLGHPKKPRSAAYKKAQNKLSKMMKSGIEKARTSWNVYNSPENKQLRAEKRYDRQTERALQKARKGKLKYGKLDDWQVQRITDRLNMERQARGLSEAERGMLSRIGKSIGNGIVTGIGRGVENRVTEKISRGGVIKTERLKREQLNRVDDEHNERTYIRDQRRKDAEYAKDQRREEAKYRRDQKRADDEEMDKLRNIAEYGAVYNAAGHINYLNNNDALTNYYNNKYIKRESKTQSRERQAREFAEHEREAARQERRENRERAKNYKRISKEMDRQQRLAEEAEAQKRHDEYWENIARENARLEASKEAERSRRTKEEGFKTYEQRLKNRGPEPAGMTLARREAEIREGAQRKRDAARRERQRIIDDYNAQQAYRHRVSSWANDISNSKALPYGSSEPYGYVSDRTGRRKKRYGRN